MKNIFITFLAVSLLLTPFTLDALSDKSHDGETIEWHDFNTGFELAKTNGKIAVIDCYTDWCGWCKKMDKETFTDGSVITKMNESFVGIKFNPEIKGKKYYINGDTLSGSQLLYALSNNKPSGYPTFFFYIPQNSHMIQQPGYQNVEKFTKTMADLVDYQSKLPSN
jgi:thioredoxin-related protein